MDKSYLTLLPKDLQYIYTQHLSDRQLEDISESNPELANIIELWGKKAEKDFGYPYEMFRIYGYKYESQIEHYLDIKKKIPTKESLQLLNKIQSQWNIREEDWDLIYDPLIDDYGMTKKEADMFMDDIQVIASGPFIRSNSIQLINEFQYSNYKIGVKEKKFKYKTIIRADNENNITYRDIIENVRQVIPEFVKYLTIRNHKYKSFNKDGIPIILVDIDF